jgi:hypothetical protein
MNIAALGNNEHGENTSVQKMQLSALGKQLVAKISNLKTGKASKRKAGRLRGPAKELACALCLVHRCALCLGSLRTLPWVVAHFALDIVAHFTLDRCALPLPWVVAHFTLDTY